MGLDHLQYLLGDDPGRVRFNIQPASSLSAAQPDKFRALAHHFIRPSVQIRRQKRNQK